MDLKLRRSSKLNYTTTRHRFKENRTLAPMKQNPLVVRRRLTVGRPENINHLLPTHTLLDLLPKINSFLTHDIGRLAISLLGSVAYIPYHLPLRAGNLDTLDDDLLDHPIDRNLNAFFDYTVDVLDNFDRDFDALLDELDFNGGEKDGTNEPTQGDGNQ